MSDQPTAVYATADHVGRTCPYCRFPFKEGVPALECGSCRAVHHMECWQDNRGCAVMGCPSAPAAEPAAPPPPAFAQPQFAPPAPPYAPPPQPSYAVPPPLTGSGARPASATAEEFVGQVQTWLKTPTALAIGTAAATALAVMAAVGFVTAILTPDYSFVGGGGAGAGVVKETLRTLVATTMARYGGDGFSVTLLPVTFVLAPLLGSALGAYRTAPQSAGQPARRRLLIGAAVAVPLALLVLLLSLFAGQDGAGFSGISVILYTLLWGALGGAAGTAYAIGPEAAATAFGGLPPAVLRWLRLAGTALKPLAALLVAMAVLGFLVWEVQVIRDQDGARFGRGIPTAIIETPLLAGEYAINGVALGTFARFQPLGEESGPGPLPLEDDGDNSGFGERFRVFAYKDSYPLAIFVPLVILLIGASLACATFAGYATATAAGARQPGLAAAYGALVGPVWAVVMTLLRAISDLQAIIGDSLFISVLLVGAVAGAVGGLLSALRPTT